jgi:hypothetical protein
MEILIVANKELFVAKAPGLYTYSDVFPEISEGTMSAAINVVIDKRDVIEPRRGYIKSGSGITGTTALSSLHNYTNFGTANELWVHRTAPTSNWSRYNGTTWTYGVGSIGTPAIPTDSNSIRTLNAHKSLYYTDDTGIFRITPNYAPAGVPECTIANMSLTNSATYNYIPNGDSIKYVVLIARTLADDTILLGPPSVSEYINNNAGADRTVSIGFQIPAGVRTGDRVQLYSTGPQTNVLLPDEYYLIYENTLSSLTKGTIMTIVDTSLGSLGTPLYTNSTQEGIAQSNYIPPVCHDLTSFNSYIFFSGITERASWRASVGAMATGVFFNINNIEYETATTNNSGTTPVKVKVDYPALTIKEESARNLVEMINVVDPEINAYYDSTPEDAAQGNIRLEAAPQTTLASIVFEPFLGTEINVLNDTARRKRYNRMYYSKYGQGEAVPLLNYFDIGPANNRILRIVALRDVLLIFTTNGTYKLTGSYETQFQVTPMDLTLTLIAPDSIDVVGDVIYGLFDTGIMAVNGSGSEDISLRIKDIIIDLLYKTSNYHISLSRGVAYEEDNKYILTCPHPTTFSAGTPINGLQIVYHINTGAITTWEISDAADGIVYNGDGKLYWAKGDGVVLQERKSFTHTDFVDQNTSVTINSVSSLNLTLATVPSTVNVGDLITKGVQYAKITAINGSIITVDGGIWTTGAAVVNDYIPITMTFNPISDNSPAIMKQWSEANILVDAPFQDATFAFFSHNSQSYATIDVEGVNLGGWGMFPWGQVAWGGDELLDSYRTYVPRDKQRSPYVVFRITQNTVYNKFQYSGISLIYRPIGQRIRR